MHTDHSSRILVRTDPTARIPMRDILDGLHHQRNKKEKPRPRNTFRVEELTPGP